MIGWLLYLTKMAVEWPTWAQALVIIAVVALIAVGLGAIIGRDRLHAVAIRVVSVIRIR